MRELGKEIEVSVAKEKARLIGGEKEVEKVDEDYEVRVSRQKAKDILSRMRDKLEQVSNGLELLI